MAAHAAGTTQAGSFASAFAAAESTGPLTLSLDVGAGAGETATADAVASYDEILAVHDALEALARDREIPGFVIVAPPRALADLRQSFGTDTKSRIMAEIDKDLTGHPIKDIEKHLTA
mgnify:CR=1 FL=1